MSDTAGGTAKAAGTVGVSVFGDSHCSRFAISRQMIACMPLLRAVDLALHPFSGGTITGFGKRSSSLGIADKIRTAIRPYDRLLVFNFGQVDVELGYFYDIAHVMRLIRLQHDHRPLREIGGDIEALGVKIVVRHDGFLVCARLTTMRPGWQAPATAQAGQ